MRVTSGTLGSCMTAPVLSDQVRTALHAWYITDEYQVHINDEPLTAYYDNQNM